jgi:beta-mannosidase
MQFQSLNGPWLLRQDGTEKWLPAQVPGGVHTDLMAAGRIPDPFTGLNEEKVQWVAEKDWEYRRYFHPMQSVLAQDTIYLTCKGLDTLAEVRLNGKILGVTSNMFRTWKWEVKSLLKEGENRLDIRFRSPLAHIRQRQRVNPMSEMNMGIRGGPHLRKTPSHFGWDWGPRCPVPASGRAYCWKAGTAPACWM